MDFQGQADWREEEVTMAKELGLLARLMLFIVGWIFIFIPEPATTVIGALAVLYSVGGDLLIKKIG